MLARARGGTKPRAQPHEAPRSSERHQLRRVMGRVHPDRVQHVSQKAAEANSEALGQLNAYLTMLRNNQRTERTHLRFFSLSSSSLTSAPTS